MECFEALYQSPIDAFRDLVSSHAFLSDFLAVLMQLSYGPISNSSGLNKSEIPHMIREARKKLRSLLARLPRPVALKELFLFQCGFAKNKVTIFKMYFKLIMERTYPMIISKSMKTLEIVD